MGLLFLSLYLFFGLHQGAVSASRHPNCLDLAIDFDLIWLHVDVPAPAGGTKAVGTIIAA
jgi:hypothetical protein